ncbi:hypothetical protein V8G54_027977 [Vigna mungo]|uniref:Uncharacterized protein n=1 Tax=Vigna mungo TaxID=3915 RepID=A0AAQ3MRQ5_VIGMU
MPRQIHPCSFIVPGYPQQIQLMKPVEQRPHRHRNPPTHHHYLNQLRRQQLPAAAHQRPARPPNSINLFHVLPLREQPREQHPPGATPAVKLRRLQRVIVLHFRCQLVKPNQNPGGHKPTHYRGPGLHNRTA